MEREAAWLRLVCAIRASRGPSTSCTGLVPVYVLLLLCYSTTFVWVSQTSVGRERDSSTKTQARGSHGRRTAKQLAQIGKYRENGNTAVARRFERFLLLVTVAVIELPSKEEGAKHGIFGDRCPTLCSPFTTMTA